MDTDSNPLQVVVAIIRDPHTGRLLFQERNKAPYLGYFGLVGGKVESSETRDDAVTREIKEETGLDVQTLTYLQVVHETMTSDENSHFLALHVYLVDAIGHVQANLIEGKVHWLDEDHFNTKKHLYIPTDWLIVNAVINEEKIFSSISVEDNGDHYAVKAIN